MDLQGSTPNLQGSSPALQPAINPAAVTTAPLGPPAPTKTPTGGGAAATPNTTVAYSFLDGSGYNSAGQQVRPPSVVTAKAATTDLAKKQADLTTATNAQATQANNVATNNLVTTNNNNNNNVVNANTQALTNATNAVTGTTTDSNAPKTQQQQLADVQAGQDAAYNNLTNQVSQIMQGTFPLTPDQQSQVNSLQQQFDQLKQQQLLANQNYTGGVTNAGIAAGRNRYAPEIELGNIQATVTAGIQKIANIEAQAASAISQLKQGFMDNDYKMINDAYTQASNYFKQKSDAITGLADSVRQDTQLALAQHKQAMDDAKQEQDKQNAARDFAVTHNINAPAYLVGNTAINTATGEQLDLAGYQQLTGQKVGLPESETDFSQLDTNVQATGKYTAATDAFGNPISFNTLTGQYSNQDGSPVDLSQNPTLPNSNGVTFGQYGLLANTDFNPNDQTDALAQKYMDSYIKNGTVPTASTLGRAIKPGQLAQIDQRARDLYFKATGNPMPNPEVLKGLQGILKTNNQLSNNLAMQENTISQNFGLNIDNLTTNNLNSSIPILNNVINDLNNAFGDPNTAQYLTQNATLQQEAGNLLAVKNASGTTVFDKMAAAGLIPKNASKDQQVAIMKILLKEAGNAADAITQANGEIYKQIDPLMQDPNNPLRQQYQQQNPTTVTDYVSAHPEQSNMAKQIIQDHPDWSEEDVIQALNSLGGLTTKTPLDVNKAFGSGGLTSEGSGSSNAQSYTDLQKRNLSFAPTNATFTSVKIGAGAAVKNNNPGNLRNIDGSWQKFKTPDEGFKALLGYVERAKSGDQKRYNANQSLYQFFNIYAPSGDNNLPNQYAESVAKKLGVSPNTPIGKLNTLAFAKAIANHESSTQIA